MRRLLVPAAVLIVLLLSVVSLSFAPVPGGAPRPTLASTAPAESGASTCPTPQTIPDWSSAEFFQDANVSITVPGSPGLSGANFQTVPCSNTIPTYETGFWLNVSTNVNLSYAFLRIWGTTWTTVAGTYPPLPGFPYANPTLVPMYIEPSDPQTAAFFFNVYKYFWPGSTVYFNITLETTQASPTAIYSTESPYSEPTPYAGSPDNASWMFYVAAPWWSTDFSGDIGVTTTPPVTGVPAYQPNPEQAFQVELQSLGPTGGLGIPIPDALLTFRLSGNFTGLYSVPFGPLNASFENLTSPIGPYPGTSVAFNVTAWLPWRGGQIDVIASPTFYFNWSTAGRWPNPSLGLEENAEISSTPDIFGATPRLLPTGTPVNVTLHEPEPNVTIGSAVVHFAFADGGANLSGNLRMSFVSANTTYAVLPGLPAGGVVTMSVVAKDIYGDALSSGSTTYSESGAMSVGPGPGTGLVFVEAENLATGTFIPSFHFTLTSAAFSGSGVASPLGIGALRAPGTGGFYFEPAGNYTLTATAYGRTLSTPLELMAGGPVVVRFTFANGTFGASASSRIPGVTVALATGLVGVGLVSVPALRWYRERRARYEAEQRKLTL